MSYNFCSVEHDLLFFRSSLTLALQSLMVFNYKIYGKYNNLDKSKSQNSHFYK